MGVDPSAAGSKPTGNSMVWSTRPPSLSSTFCLVRLLEARKQIIGNLADRHHVAASQFASAARSDGARVAAIADDADVACPAHLRPWHSDRTSVVPRVLMSIGDAVCFLHTGQAGEGIVH